MRSKRKRSNAILPVEESVGYQIRMTHRALQRSLQAKIEPHGVTLGMWYYLRTLWNEDGLTQRELSRRIETMEPSTLTAIQLLERKGLVRRVRNKTDRRKLHVFLTPAGRKLKDRLLPLAREAVAAATTTLNKSETRALLRSLLEIRKNLSMRSGDVDSGE
jgi:DNA-binding MarR family transcriptional regulator